METSHFHSQICQFPQQFMTHFPTKLCPHLLLRFSTTTGNNFRLFSTTTTSATPSQDPSIAITPEQPNPLRKTLKGKGSKLISHAQLRENWLDSLSCPFPQRIDGSNCKNELLNFQCNGCMNVGSKWVIGVDPDVSGALALLKADQSAQVFDSPHLKVLVGGRIRKRLDTRSIVQLLHSFEAPIGTTAYIEQSIPYPKDGKQILCIDCSSEHSFHCSQGWWSGGFGYGLWIGILVASGFSVVPVPSVVWKNAFKLSGSSSTKDDSREVASTMFPSLSSLLKRKKDHGRAEALLIAAYGKGLKMNFNASFADD